MNFLVDAQLPPALCRWLEARGCSAVHVVDVLNGETGDAEIARYAAAARLVVMTKDDDFAARHAREALQIVWLRVGNASNRRLATWLDDRWAAITAALEAGEGGNRSAMTSLPLTPHPDHPPTGTAFKLWVNLDRSAAFGESATVNLFFCVGAPAARFVIPAAGEGERADQLWQSTCFEAFLRREGDPRYTEWNFAPSGDWAAYAFAGHRLGMANAEVGAPPYIRVEDNLTWWGLGATIAVPADASFRLGLSAVLEERDGTKSYWALAHAPGAADFHHDDCFAARLG